jgi:hypothetical protein
VLAGVVALALILPAAAAAAPASWPPAEGPGTLFVHFGEEHWNDADGLTLLPKVVADTARYRPALVTMSGDKGNDGEPGQLARWKQIMGAYDRAGVPYLAGVGNHDRKAPPGVPGGVSPTGDIANYTRVFADRPYPFGDAAPYRQIGPSRPKGDPPGAASHYFADVANVRWIFIDNSCFGIVNCDALQAPPDGEGLTQYEYLAKHGGAASAQGRRVFVVMHMPTRDPRDQSYADATSVNHVMGKGASPDNSAFEAAAEKAGVDGVFVGHIKGQFLYRGRGGVPYYIDGGAGGELYTEGPIGTDHGYWHGYRLVRVDGDRIVTDTVPIFAEDGITITDAPGTVGAGERATFRAFGRQPVLNDPAKVERLALRDPDPTPKRAGAGFALPDAALFAGPPLLLLLVAGAAASLTARRRAMPLAFAAALLVTTGAGAVAVAQSDGTPTATPKESLPTPARIWTSSEPLVLAPVAGERDDSRRDTATQTNSGSFVGRCPGHATVSITSGWESAETAVRVPSADGPIFAGVRRRARNVRRGRRTLVAGLILAQPARVAERVLRGRTVVRNLGETCRAAGRVPVAWDGRATRGSQLRVVPRGRYVIEVRVRSDRRTIVRRLPLRVR